MTREIRAGETPDPWRLGTVADLLGVRYVLAAVARRRWDAGRAWLARLREAPTPEGPSHGSTVFHTLERPGPFFARMYGLLPPAAAS